MFHIWLLIVFLEIVSLLRFKMDCYTHFNLKEKKRFYDCLKELKNCPLGHKITISDMEQHMIKKHIRYGVECTRNGETILSLPCWRECTKRLKSPIRSHYHCPSCAKLFSRSTSIRYHKSHCKGNITEEESTISNVDQHEDFSCVHDKKSLSERTSLRRRTHRVNFQFTEPHLPSICVHLDEGIFLVAKSEYGPIEPIHVQKHGETTFCQCSSQLCKDLVKEKIAVTGNPAVECMHLEAVKEAQIPAILPLNLKYLNKLVLQQVLSSTCRQQCEALFHTSRRYDCPLVVHADFEELGYNDKTLYYSVYTNEKKDYCQYGRVMVTLAKLTGVWSCKCTILNIKCTCVHIGICKWYMKQYQKELLI